MKKTPIKTVIAIIKDLEIGDLTDHKISEKYGISIATVSAIKKREGLTLNPDQWRGRRALKLRAAIEAYGADPGSFVKIAKELKG